MTWTIARPTLDDLDEMGRVHVQVWREAYAGLLPADYLAGLDPTFGPTRWRERFGSSPEVSWWLARDEEGIAGMATSGPPRDEDPPAPLELYAINVLSRAHGTGLADDLMARAVGDRPAYLWVLEGNERALAFYRRHGFYDEGGRKPEPETGVVELRLARGHTA
ncbi:MAG TPA: GNAT family N-acetyltransferase [Nocardioides sp.]|nr:GNAT family N-acetyltransferase [Nocardioides sp.]